MTIGELIKRARSQSNLSQKELAEKLGVSASMIGQYENNLRKPKIETITKIAKALDINPIELTKDASDYPIVAQIPVEEFLTQSREQQDDILSDIDIAFYDGYRELSEDDKETIRRMVEVMRERRKDKK